MSRFLVNIQDGTVCDLEGMRIVDTETLNSEGLALLQAYDESGADSVACELGSLYGVPLNLSRELF